MRTLALILLSVTLCSCSTQNERLIERIKFSQKYEATYPDTAPRYFWKGPGAENGQMVLAAIRSGNTESKAKAQALIGSSVVFVGEGTDLLRKDIRADLETRDKIKIMVDIIPFKRVHPGPCGEWGVEVKGKLESVDFEKRIIRIEARPEDWKDTWQL